MSQAKVKIEEDGDILRFVPQVVGQEPYEVNCSQFPEDIQLRGRNKGIMETVRDSYSDQDAEFCIAAAQARVKTLMEGKWSKVRTASGGMGRATLLAKALARVVGKEVEEAVKLIIERREEDEDFEKRLRATPQIQLAINDIKREELQAKLDAGEGGDVLQSIA